MTVVAAIKDPERSRVIIASNTTAHYSGLRLRNGPKWRVHDGWGFGIAGDQRAQNVADAFKVELLGGLTEPWEFCTRWLKVLDEQKFDLKPATDESVPHCRQDGILVNTESIWIIPGAFSFIECQEQFYADGSGRDFAIGAAHALKDLSIDPDETITRATQAAIDNSTSCGGPIWIGQVS